MRYSEIYLTNHDIDWFCNVNGIFIHVASAGGRIPDQINDDESLRKIQNKVELLEDIYTDDEIVYNEAAITNVLGVNNAKGRAQYIESFTAMARKGFASFDRTNIADSDDKQYHLVCMPNSFENKPSDLGLYTVNTNDGFMKSFVELIENYLKWKK